VIAAGVEFIAPAAKTYVPAGVLATLDVEGVTEVDRPRPGAPWIRQVPPCRSGLRAAGEGNIDVVAVGVGCHHPDVLSETGVSGGGAAHLDGGEAHVERGGVFEVLDG
jgi:hypothetical protein